MTNVQLIDQSVSIDTQDSLETLLLGDKIAWFRQASSTYPKQWLQQGRTGVFPTTPESLDTHQFGHAVWEGGAAASAVFNNVVPVVNAIPHAIKRLVRIKINLCVHAKTAIADAYGVPHIDFIDANEPFMTAIYYVNDSSGDTIIFNEKYGCDALTIRTRVSPKKGRLAIFEGDRMHAGNTPRSNDPRITINFDFTTHE